MFPWTREPSGKVPDVSGGCFSVYKVVTDNDTEAQTGVKRLPAY